MVIVEIWRSDTDSSFPYNPTRRSQQHSALSAGEQLSAFPHPQDVRNATQQQQQQFDGTTAEPPGLCRSGHGFGGPGPATTHRGLFAAAFAARRRRRGAAAQRDSEEWCQQL